MATYTFPFLFINFFLELDDVFCDGGDDSRCVGILDGGLVEVAELGHFKFEIEY